MAAASWALRAAYKFSAKQVTAALRAVAGLPKVHLEDSEAAVQAIERATAGMDFTGALHVASRGGALDFATFDAKFVKQGQRVGAGRVQIL